MISILASVFIFSTFLTFVIGLFASFYFLLKRISKINAEKFGEISLRRVNETLSTLLNLTPIKNLDLASVQSVIESANNSPIFSPGAVANETYIKGNEVLLDQNGDVILVSTRLGTLFSPTKNIIISASVNGKELIVQNDGFTKFNFIVNGEFFGYCEVNSFYYPHNPVLGIYDKEKKPVYWTSPSVRKITRLFKDSQLSEEIVTISKNHFAERYLSSFTPNTISFLTGEINSDTKLLILAFYLVDMLAF